MLDKVPPADKMQALSMLKAIQVYINTVEKPSMVRYDDPMIVLQDLIVTVEDSAYNKMDAARTIVSISEKEMIAIKKAGFTPAQAIEASSASSSSVV